MRVVCSIVVFSLLMVLGSVVAALVVFDLLHVAWRRLQLALIYGGDEALRAHEEWLHG